MREAGSERIHPPGRRAEEPPMSSGPPVPGALILKNALFTAVVPGTVTILIPWRILSSSGEIRLDGASALRYLALLPILSGLAVYLWSLLGFARTGRGTPAHIDPPRTLVVRGPYRATRNPMYAAVLLAILGEAALFASGRLLGYAALVLAVLHGFVVLYEEPALRRRFGPSYEAYCARVPRWFLSRRRREPDEWP